MCLVSFLHPVAQLVERLLVINRPPDHTQSGAPQRGNMKIKLPGNQIVDIPDDFDPIPYVKHDNDNGKLYGIDFFRKDVDVSICSCYYETLSDGTREVKSRNYINLVELVLPHFDWCYDVEDFSDIEEGVYQIKFTYIYDEDMYARREYKRGQSS